ncbi:hypothetical protein GQ53DRAFT_15519 [Thozetella sp. PMI_491]|nr:hypothetical protein GQ53DRAFT_15519 [Thozetella sp. PMI_491]
MDSELEVASYAHLCQASHLLGRVIEHTNPDRDTDESNINFTFTEALQLHRTMVSLLSVVNGKYTAADGDLRMKICSAKGILYTALMSLYYFHSSFEGDGVDLGGESKVSRAEIQKISLDGLATLAAEIRQFAQELLELPRDRLPWLSPLVIDSVYQGAVYYAWITRESGDADSLVALDELREALQGLDHIYRSLSPTARAYRV